jgi:hypothetical protein
MWTMRSREVMVIRMETPLDHPKAVRRIPARMRVALGVAVLAVAATAAATTPHAAAVPQSRSSEPIMAGTTLESDEGYCTAGLVLKDNSALGGVTEYRRSVRFILTAGHGGQVGEHFTTTAGNVVGDVVWKSTTHDLMLIRVEPRLDRGVAAGCQGVLDGDSGAPLYAFNGNVFGILYGEWGDVGPDGSPRQRGVSYTPVSEFFAEQGGYALAPAE